MPAYPLDGYMSFVLKPFGILAMCACYSDAKIERLVGQLRADKFSFLEMPL